MLTKELVVPYEELRYKEYFIITNPEEISYLYKKILSEKNSSSGCIGSEGTPLCRKINDYEISIFVNGKNLFLPDLDEFKKIKAIRVSHTCVYDKHL
jgi:hypothetical protein